MSITAFDFSKLTARINQSKTASGDPTLRDALTQLIAALNSQSNQVVNQINAILEANILVWLPEVGLFPDSALLVAGSGATTSTGGGQFVVNVSIPSGIFANLPPVPTTVLWVITDSNTNTWGANIAGGGANKVLAFFNGSHWTVVGK